MPELQKVDERSELMVACYPGDASRFVKHVDNPDGNGRVLTFLYVCICDFNRILMNSNEDLR